jgi:hypothetical protein
MRLHSFAFVHRIVLCVAALLLFRPPLPAYSVLTHEAIIDSSWDPSIKPLLLLKYPKATPEQLVEAHAYAYAGCILQDMGYYPFGSKLFSDLVHYVRSGDFVQNLLKESHDLNEYAFALGGFGALRGGYARPFDRGESGSAARISETRQKIRQERNLRG